MHFFLRGREFEVKQNLWGVWPWRNWTGASSSRTELQIHRRSVHRLVWFLARARCSQTVRGGTVADGCYAPMLVWPTARSWRLQRPRRGTLSARRVLRRNWTLWRGTRRAPRLPPGIWSCISCCSRASGAVSQSSPVGTYKGDKNPFLWNDWLWYFKQERCLSKRRNAEPMLCLPWTPRMDRNLCCRTPA